MSNNQNWRNGMRIDEGKIPKHIAIIMDGNRRWAKQHGLSAVAGHDHVAERILEPLVDRAIVLGVPFLTFWAFSTENWERDRREIVGMMRIFRRGLRKSSRRLFEKGVRIKILGDIEKFPADIQIMAKEWVEMSRENRRITVVFGLNYGGRDELLRAFGRLLRDRFERLGISRLPGVSRSPDTRRDDNAGFKSVPALSNSVTSQELEQYLDTAGMPDPDLIIRTGGEKRLSGFMAWQSAYSELYFPETLMPEFTVHEFDRAIVEFQKRSRRFGR